jgi:membrane-associated phospholipid phosphatase
MNKNDGGSRRTARLAALSAVVLLPLVILLFDRQVSSAVAATARAMPTMVRMTQISDVLLVSAVVILTAAGLAWLFGWRPGRAGRVVVVACLAAFVSWAIKEQLKFAFGRTWPETWTNNNPSWIHDGVFGFFPFHGGSGWGSFPSGHTTIISAAMMVLAIAWPRLRLLWVVPVLLVAIGLIGADYHFLSDVMAGAYLGAACGAVMAGLALPR